MLSRTHSPQKVLPITHNKMHTHSTSGITFLSFQNKEEKSSTLFCFSLFTINLWKTTPSGPSLHTLNLENPHRYDSRPISACFSSFQPFRSPANMTWFGRYSLILVESAQIEAQLARIRGKKEKEKIKCGTDARAATSDSGAAPSQPCSCFIVN